MIRKVLGVVCLTLLFVPYALEQANEETVVTPKLTTTASTMFLPSTTTTTTTLPSTTTTTSTASTYQAASSSTITNDVWDVIAKCETPPDGNWSARGTYEGGLQFLPSTWTSYVAAGKPYGLVGYPAHAYDATREQQIVVAERVRDGIKDSSDPYLNPQGWNAWPKCRHDAGV